MALTARPATLADSAFLLRLRNDQATLEGSLSTEEVSAEHHAAWLGRVLQDPARRLMIVEEPNIVERDAASETWRNGAVGTYRLDGLGSARVEVSLTVAPEYRGRGLAQAMIELAVAHVSREAPATVMADVRPANSASLVAFLKAGFTVDTRALHLTLTPKESSQ